VARAAALIDQCGTPAENISFGIAADRLDGPGARSASNKVAQIVHTVLARFELIAPIAAQGAFIPAGNSFDALAVLAKVLGSANADALIVDPYMDEKTLIEFLPSTRESVAVRLLADAANAKASLKPAVIRWQTQYGGKRPLDARIASARSLHDRVIIIDHKTAYTLTQSLNAFATRAPASVVRVDDETGQLKIGAYADIWKAATPL
jgi:hypothetical protein